MPFSFLTFTEMKKTEIYLPIIVALCASLTYRGEMFRKTVLKDKCRILLVSYSRSKEVFRNKNRKTSKRLIETKEVMI
ncbi:hypothetical protein PAALTS15_03777 [Paenibacillus alvei TS-15]|uniref:Uncharacterized protein n=1 Tax=Paenibacillus alvei TS-15 TaxID=1117108 RepID=S9SX30_PAEAL|nr:hypothetical protein PAALTS15_03777 [Paenibacillus alvei TS-15]